MRLEEVRINEYDGAVFVGCSAGFPGIEQNPAAVKLAKDFFAAGKIVAASGTAVSLLEAAGIPKDSGKVLTSAGENEVKEFADKIIVLLGGKKPLLAEQVKSYKQT